MKGCGTMIILVINAGSSSLKYQLFDMETEQVLAKGNCEKIGMEEGIFTHKTFDGRELLKSPRMETHVEALHLVMGSLLDGEHGVLRSIGEISAVGHRVAMGGPRYLESVVADEAVLREIESVSPLAPLHNPAELSAIRACQSILGEKAVQCVVFDTAFHATMPPKAYMYAIPYEYYEQYGIRRYGFHGTSHRYVSARCAGLVGRPPESLKMISCHIGNGSSLAAIDRGKVVDTSMGMTPLDGFMMGTRCGAIDPSIVTFLMEKEKLSPAEMDDILTKRSGLLGVSGVSSDDREIIKAEAQGNERAALTHDMLAYQIQKYIGSYTAAMNGLDCMLFTAGLGENQADLRRRICQGLSFFGVELDPERNAAMRGGKEGEISTDRSRVKVYVIATNEELMIARDTYQICRS